MGKEFYASATRRVLFREFFTSEQNCQTKFLRLDNHPSGVKPETNVNIFLRDPQ